MNERQFFIREGKHDLSLWPDRKQAWGSGNGKYYEQMSSRFQARAEMAELPTTPDFAERKEALL